MNAKHAVVPSLESLLEQDAWLHGLARSFFSDPNRADDLVHDTWVTALERPPRSMDSLRAWLRTVLRNLALQSLRAERRRQARERIAAPAEALPSTLDLVSRTALQRDLAGAVLELDEPYRSTILLRFFEGLSDREIASRMGLAVSTVSTRVERGLGLLRLRLVRDRSCHQASGLAAALSREGLGGSLVSRLVRAHLLLPVGAAMALLTGAWVWLASGPEQPRVAPVGLTGSAAVQSREALPDPLDPVRQEVVATLVDDPGEPEVAVPSGPASELSPEQRHALRLLEEARRISHPSEELIWPEWSLAEIPIALFESAGQALLVHHPEPPDGFLLEETELVSTELFIGPAGQAMNANTSGLLDDQVCAFVGLDSLSAKSDGGQGVSLILHEAAHAFCQRGSSGRPRWPNENASLVAAYPTQNAWNNAMGRVEGQVLRRALSADDEATLREATADFLAVRAQRQERLEPRLRQFEQQLELSEGLADYISLRALTALVDDLPAGIELVSAAECGPKGGAFLRLLERLERVNVSGQGAARQRFYSTGAAQAFLLDRLGLPWKRLVETGSVTLQELLLDGCGLKTEELANRLEHIRQRSGFEQLLTQEQVAADLLAAYRDRRLLEVLGQEPDLLVLDLSRAGGAGQTLSFDPMNIVSIDPDLRLHNRMLTLGFKGGSVTFNAPVLQDLRHDLVLVALPGTAEFNVDGEFVLGNGPELPVSAEDGVELNSPEVDLSCGPARLEREGDILLLRPEDDGQTHSRLLLARNLLELLNERARRPIQAPKLTLIDHFGRTIRLGTGQGDVRILFFFSAAAWARPSQALALDFLEAWREAGWAELPSRVVMVATQCSTAELEVLLPELGLGSGLCHDPDSRIRNLFGVRTLPAVIWIDDQGMLGELASAYQPGVADALVRQLLNR